MRCSSVPMILAITAFACTDSPETSRGVQMVVNAVNALGESVGFLEVQPGLPRATLRSASGVVVDLGTLPGGSRSAAVAVDDAGTVVGQSETASGEFRAVRWRHGTIEDLGTLPGGDFSVAIMGESNAGDGVLHAFRWQDGRMADLGRFSSPAASGAPPPRPDRR